MTPASRPSACWKGRARDGAVTALHGQQVEGKCQRNVRRFPAALSWVWMEPIIPIGNGRGQLPEVWQGEGQMKKPNRKQNVTRRAAGRLVERLASIIHHPQRRRGAHADSGESGA